VRNKNGIYMVFTCDQWKSRESMRFVGLTGDIRKLRKAVKDLITNAVVTCEEKFNINDRWSVKEMNDNIEFLYIYEARNGEFETSGSYFV